MLNGSITVIATDLHSINVSWQPTNYLNFYQYTITIKSVTDNEGQRSSKTFHLEGTPTEISVDQLWQDSDGDPVALNLSPFTNYGAVALSKHF